MNKYIVINTDFIEEKIKELEESLDPTSWADNLKNMGKTEILQELLTISLPLDIVIKKTFEAGRNLTIDSFEESDFQDLENFLSTLKFNI